MKGLTLRLYRPKFPLPEKREGVRMKIDWPLLGSLCGESPADKSGITVIERLKPEALRVSANVGTWGVNPGALDWAEVQLQPKTRTTVTLNLEGLMQSVHRVPMRGTVVFHESWPRSSFYLIISPIAGDEPSAQKIVFVESKKMQQLTEQPFKAAWDAGLVLPGKYAVALRGIGLTLAVEVGPSGNQQVRLVVPARVRVAVKVEDRISGERVQDAEVYWFGGRPEGARGSGSESAVFDSQTGLFRLNCPRGKVRIYARAPGINREHTEIQARPPEQQVTLSVGRPRGIRLVFVSCGESIAINSDLKVATTPLAKLRKSYHRKVKYLPGWSKSATSVTLPLKKPGPYRVTFKDGPAGFEPLSPCEMEVVADRITDLRIELVKLL